MKKAAVLVLFVLHVGFLQAGYVCRDESYVLGLSNCYKLFDSRRSFSDASDTCIAANSVLVKIVSEAENSFINSTFAKSAPFWIGLNDIEEEGVFRWTDNQVLAIDAYNAWLGGEGANTNALNFDCVHFNSDGLWEVQQDFCSNSQLLFLCKQSACNSSDGVECDDDKVPTDTSLGGGIIAVIVIIPIVIVLIIVIVIVLIYLWKYENDFFNKYICCCAIGGSKANMNSLKQEIQRLQTELSQQKLNSSGRFQSPLMSRQTSTMSMQQPRVSVPVLTRSLSSNKVHPMNMQPPNLPPMRQPPGLGRGLSGTHLIKPQLSAVSEENTKGNGKETEKENKDEDEST